MFGVAKVRGVFARPRHFRARDGGAEREALARRAGERRIEAKNLVEQSETGAGEKSAVGAYNASGRRPRPRRKRLLQQLVGGRDVRRGEPARPPPRQGDGRPLGRVAGGTFVVEGVGGRESDHALV
jgi:hypothetical protein